MSDQIAALMDAVAADEELKAKLSAAQSVDELVAIAGENGFVVTSEEVVDALNADRAVSDAELEGAAGGAKSGIGMYGICSAGFVAPAILPTDCQ